MSTKRYINGVRIGRWFLRQDDVWLHRHDSNDNFFRKWHQVKEDECLLCRQRVPPEIEMQCKLQKLGEPYDEVVSTFWPVYPGVEVLDEDV